MLCSSVWQRNCLRWLLALVVAATLALIAVPACASAATAPATLSSRLTPPLGQTRADDSPPLPAWGTGPEAEDYAPRGPAATLTEIPFWLILGLVVLSWLMLAAEAPRADL